MKTYKEIKLDGKNKKMTKVDCHLFELLSKYKWYDNGQEYVFANKKNGKKIYMHRFILNAPKNKEVDHINGDPLDNRIYNLRLVNRSQNMMNRAGTTGVWYSKQKKKWVAEIIVKGIKKHLGLFKDKQDAVAVRNNAEKVYFEEYANKNKKKYIVGLTFGVFDLCHQGHIRLLQNAKKYVDTLIVCVSTDKFVLDTKDKKSYIKFRNRRKTIEEFDIVATTDEQSKRFGKKEAIAKYCPDLLFVGDDHLNNYTGEGFGVKVIYLPRTKGISSTKLRQ